MTVSAPDAATLLGIRKAIRDCTDCDLRKTARSPVPWRGELEPDILIIGEAPGSTEDKEGQPFIGTAGIKLQGLLRESGLAHVATISYANACQCFPDRGLNARNATDVSYVDACRKWMRAQVAAIRPQYIVTVGTIAFRSIWGDLQWPTLQQIHGKPLYWDDAPPHSGKGGAERPTCVWSTYHPSAALRSGKYKKLILEDLRAFKSWVDMGEVWPEWCMVGECKGQMSSYDKHGRGIVLCGRHEVRQGELFDG